MGINGLLPKLGSITRAITLQDFANKRVAIDAYVWLHKASYACASDVCQNNATDRFAHCHPFSRVLPSLPLPSLRSRSISSNLRSRRGREFLTLPACCSISLCWSRMFHFSRFCLTPSASSPFFSSLILHPLPPSPRSSLLAPRSSTSSLRSDTSLIA